MSQTSSKPIKSVAVIGAGVIGASWSALFLAHGLSVVASDPAPGAEKQLRAFVAKALLDLRSLGYDGLGDLTFVEDARARWHRPQGIWLLHGSGVQPGALKSPVRLDQITPTILRLLDLPLARDMKGQPIDEALSTSFLADHPAG